MRHLKGNKKQTKKQPLKQVTLGFTELDKSTIGTYNHCKKRNVLTANTLYRKLLAPFWFEDVCI